jgi:hypothetical protein
MPSRAGPSLAAKEAFAGRVSYAEVAPGCRINQTSQT